MTKDTSSIETAEIEIADNRRLRMRDIIVADFWTRMQKPVGCWLFDGAKEINGYGYVKNPLGDKPKYLTAHRLAWILKNGAVPEGKLVLHTCDVRACCNPDHLFLGTHADNTVDKIHKGRQGTSGESNIHSKLTADKVRDIRRLFVRIDSKKSNLKALSKQFGVNTGSIRAIVLRKTWKHLT